MAKSVSCRTVYPVGKQKDSITELDTVGIELTKAQAKELAKALNEVSEESQTTVDVTAYRHRNRITIKPR